MLHFIRSWNRSLATNSMVTIQHTMSGDGAPSLTFTINLGQLDDEYLERLRFFFDDTLILAAFYTGSLGFHPVDALTLRVR